MTTKIDLMTTLCSAFGVFSAFGAAILAFFTAGGGLQRLTTWLTLRVKKAHGVRRAALMGDALVWLVAGVVALEVIISGLGLFTSFFWLKATANGSGHASRWAYTFADNMFYLEAVVVTVITVVAVIGTAIAALPGGQGGDASNKPARPTR
ncbi:MAG TPA: hypothetical protein VHO07_27485 [Streptosporangiaceae bacterium]|nr:hypothetical protein [Streptosporangiaceae bacterium]